MARLTDYKPLINRIPPVKCKWEYKGINYAVNDARDYAKHCVRVLEENRGRAEYMPWFYDLQGILKHFRLIER